MGGKGALTGIALSIGIAMAADGMYEPSTVMRNAGEIAMNPPPNPINASARIMQCSATK